MKIKLKGILLSVLTILLPYGLFGLCYFVLFYLHTGLFLNYVVPDGFYVLAVFSMLFLIVGSTIMSPLDLSMSVVADITTPSGNYEIVNLGGGNYSVGERGSAGIGIIILKFIVNLLIAPFMVLFWFVIVGLILLKGGYAEDYVKTSESKIMIASTILVVIGVVLAGIEYGCVHVRDAEYSPDKFVFETTSLELVSRHFYKKDIVADTYSFDITVNHPHVYELKEIEIKETIVMYNNESINRLTWEVNVFDYGPSETIMEPGKDTIYHHDGKMHCTFVNYYLELGHETEQNGSKGLDFERYDGFIKLSDIDISKIEVRCLLRQVNFDKNQFSYIRLEHQKGILIKNNF